MEKFIITGGKKLQGRVKVSGAKNVALKVLVAACLTDEKVTIHNVPHISDFFVMVDIMKNLGAQVNITGHTVKIHLKKFAHSSIPLDKAALARTSAMFIAPLLVRTGEAIIPNPGGCRLGARPIDRTVEGIRKMKATIVYHSEDGYFHAKTKGLEGIDYTFDKNTHTGTETLILAAVLAKGKTVLKNAAEEPEINDLISLLNLMGAQIVRSAPREISIYGVEKLHGAEFTISPDRNEIVTFAIAALLTHGDVTIQDANKVDLESFLNSVEQARGGIDKQKNAIRFYWKEKLRSTDVTTSIYPGFMTDWQAPWAVLMTQAKGKAIVHETVFENKLGYIKDLKKMGATVKLFNPKVKNPETTYNFNLADDSPEYFHAVEIEGPTELHDAVVTMLDIRAGAAVVLAALIAKGKSTIYGIEKLDRGYERFEERLTNIGANIERVKTGI